MLFDSVTVWRPAEVGCSVALLTVVIKKAEIVECAESQGFLPFPGRKHSILVAYKNI